ncbi:26S proteasome regulatory complex subunit PSMD5 [Klebsormidium nitens]|uniref:26S proteasome regulatory complex subunit PSMD5 n=1 Tax=Klebsormidium nitens TaxID=105231 RepID=A0A1Y1HJ77_KLENI|nr:26S proteasome regulatory complex subunit PSMD5 [Klebsormidium nitens]|eukprot:GAQ78580.1 26S proteasome regulatory complex subunit PSMD5 [Klebsormidium nitens]
MAQAMDVDGEGDMDTAKFLNAAHDLSLVLGVPSDDVIRSFLAEYPLPMVFRLLQQEADDPQSVETICNALDKVFLSPYGRSLLPLVVPAAAAGLQASQPRIRKLACTQILRLLDHNNAASVSAVRSIDDAHLIEPLLETLADSDEGVAKTASAALQSLASHSDGLAFFFRKCERRLKDLTVTASSTVQMRAFQLAADIAASSPDALAAVRTAGLLRPLVDDLSQSTDVLSSINALELLGEIAKSPHGASFVVEGQLPRQLEKLIAGDTTDGFVRSRAMMVAARLVSPEGGRPSPLDEQEASALVRAFNDIIVRAEDDEDLEGVDDLEDSAIDALGQMGTSASGAELLLREPDVAHPAARHVARAVFTRMKSSQQLAAIHALASIAGAERHEPSPILSTSGEDSLKNLVYGLAAGTSYHTPGAVLWHLLQQSDETRVATYRLITVVVARHWGISEVCAHEQLVSFLSDPASERSKQAMEWRHSACVAAASAAQRFASTGEVSLSSEAVNKLDAAARRGPYLSATGRPEAIPTVTTDQRPGG